MRFQNTKFLLIILLPIFLYSCSQKNYSFFSYNEYNEKGTINYKFTYIVDSLYISSPITFYKEGHWYICADTILKNYKIDDSFFNRTDVYLYLDDFFRLLQVDSKYFNPRIYSNEYKMVESKERVMYKNHTYPVRRFNKSNVRFLLGLVNGDFYEQSTACLDCTYKRRNVQDAQNVFLKVLTTY